MTKKKYDNGVDSGVRHHYDVYEDHGIEAYHIAPFASEYQAQRVADALAALEHAERNYPYVKGETFVKYVVRARPSAAHKIYETSAPKIHGQITRFHELTTSLVEMSHNEGLEIIAEQAKPKYKGKKKKDKSAA